MTWEHALLFTNVLGIAGLLLLSRSAPCWMQAMVVWLLIAGCVLIAGSYVWAMFSDENHWRVRNVGYAIEHIAVLLYVFRVVYQRLQWKSSPPLHNSAR